MPQSMAASLPLGMVIYVRVLLMNAHSHPGLRLCGPIFFFFSHGFHQEEPSLCLTSLSNNFNINSSASSGPRAPAVARRA